MVAVLAMVAVSVITMEHVAVLAVIMVVAVHGSGHINGSSGIMYGYDHIHAHPDIVRKGFKKSAGIIKSLTLKINRNSGVVPSLTRMTI